MDKEKLLYTKEHEWISIQDDVAVIGITDYAQEELGDIVFVELPELGAILKAGDNPVTLESVKAVSSVYTPFDGEVIEVNDKLNDEPEVINSSPLNEGWIYKMKVASRNEEQLFNLKEYDEYIKELD